MATTTALGSGSTNNNGGTVLNVGSNGDQLSNLALGAHTPDNKLVHDGSHVDEAYSGGELAYDDSRPTSKGLPYTRGGVDAGTLSPALVPELTQGVHRIEAIKTNQIATAIRAGYWDISSGTWAVAPSGADDTFHKAVSGTAEIDYATRGNKVTYMVGNTPVTDSY